jgi:Lar family restriction alleviation protein
MSEELLPCPFCAGTPELQESNPHDHGERVIFAVFCFDCGTEQPWKTTAEEAAISWNTRNPSASSSEALLDDVWNAAVEQSAVIADSCVHLTPDPGAAIRVMRNGRARLYPAIRFALTSMSEPQEASK